MRHGYSVSKDDYLVVGAYDLEELSERISEQDRRILRRYLAPTQTQDARVIALIPASVRDRAPDDVRLALGEMPRVTVEIWERLLEASTQIDEDTITAIMGEFTSEEWQT